VFTAREIARIKDMDVQELWRQAAENAKRFFGLE
jgi:Tat protein secretion system quality control protein TatD with DNase activity